MAKDVRIKFDPPLRSALFMRQADDYDLNSLQMFREGIPAMPPGKTYTALFDRLSDRIGSDLPRTYKASVHFFDTRGRKQSLDYLLDLNLYMGLRYLDVRKLHHGVKALEEIQQTLKRWTAHFDGLRVYQLHGYGESLPRKREEKGQGQADEGDDEGS